MNTDQKPKTTHAEDEPYIRDLTAVNLGVEIRTQADAMALCEGSDYYCEMCGEKFPLWPIRMWAAHYVDKHHDEITVQQSSAVGQFCTEELSDGVRQWLAMQLLVRTEVRRRARDLGLIRFQTRIGIVD